MRMPAAKNTAPLHSASSRQAGVVRVALAAFSIPLRLSLASALPSEASRPMAVLDMPVQVPRGLSTRAGNELLPHARSRPGRTRPPSLASATGIYAAIVVSCQ